MNAIPMPYLIKSPVFWYLSSNHSIHIQYPSFHIDAAASTAPAALNVLELVILTSTGYIHSMYFAQLQYANFLPKYLPAYGTITIVKTNSSCCRLASHSFCASESPSSESRSLLSIDEGKESTSSWSFDDSGEASWMMYESEVDILACYVDFW